MRLLQRYVHASPGIHLSTLATGGPCPPRPLARSALSLPSRRRSGVGECRCFRPPSPSFARGPTHKLTSPALRECSTGGSAWAALNCSPGSLPAFSALWTRSRQRGRSAHLLPHGTAPPPPPPAPREGRLLPAWGPRLLLSPLHSLKATLSPWTSHPYNTSSDTSPRASMCTTRTPSTRPTLP